MTVTVKDKSQLLIPSSLQRRAGFKMGDRLEFKVSQGVITIAAKAETVDEEYSASQRQAIKAEVAEVQKGPYHGPFQSGDEFAAYFKVYKRRRPSTKA